MCQKRTKYRTCKTRLTEYFCRIFLLKNCLKKVKNNFPDSVILKTDPNYIQGFPDLIILYKDKWVALECKKSEKAHHQPNQEYYISKMNSMSYASFVYPENERRVLDEMESALRGSRRARISKSK